MKKLYIFMILLYSVMLTGCAKEITDEQSDILAEYMAGTVLNNTVGYDDELIYPDDFIDPISEDVADNSTDEDKEETANNAETNTQNDNNAVQVGQNQTGTTTVINSNSTVDDKYDKIDYVGLMEEVGYKNFNINYSKFALHDKYPNDNSYYSLETSKDKKLLVLTFDITNLSKKTQNINLLESNITYQLDNDGISYNPMITMLTNDIQYIDLDFAAKETKKAVIVFEVLKDIDISNTNLIIFYQNKTTVIDIN